MWAGDELEAVPLLRGASRVIDLSLRWQIVQGDALDTLRTLAPSRVALVLSDPPYRFASVGGGFYGAWDGNGHQPREYLGKLAELDCTTFDPAALLAWLPDVPVVLCCNKDVLLDYLQWARGRSWLYDIHFLWKSNPIPAKQSHYLHDVEYVAVMRPPRSTFVTDAPFDDYRKVLRAYNDGDKLHPAQKPVGLMGKYIRTLSRPGDLVVDPYCGSGTTGVACVLDGRRFVGIEVNAKYCEIARRRIADAAAQGNLFDGETA